MREEEAKDEEKEREYAEKEKREREEEGRRREGEKRIKTGTTEFGKERTAEVEEKRRVSEDRETEGVRKKVGGQLDAPTWYGEREREKYEKRTEKGEKRKDERDGEGKEEGEKKEKEEKEKEGGEKPFFRCREDKTIATIRDLEEAQADPESKCMEYVRGHINVWHNKTSYALQDGLYIAKREGEEWGRVVVPECLRAHVLRTFHNSELASHPGEKRTFLQIRQVFFWPGMKNEISRWVKACLACRKRKTPRPFNRAHAGKFSKRNCSHRLFRPLS